MFKFERQIKPTMIGLEMDDLSNNLYGILNLNLLSSLYAKKIKKKLMKLVTIVKATRLQHLSG